MSVPAEAPRVLVADDQPDVLQAVRLLLKGEGYVVETAASPAAVARQLQEHDFDVVLLDLNYARDTTSGAEGMDLLRRIRAVHPSLPLVVMTAWGSVEGAVEAMRVGARDYVEKPWDNHRLLAIHPRAGGAGPRPAHGSPPGRREPPAHGRCRRRGSVVAESRAMRDVLAMVRRIAPSDASVLITGEHGTGKEVIARRLHAESARASRPLVTVHAGGIATGVVESELFGHVKGAFTDAKTERIGYFESAHRGTLFLDEIGTMPMSLQAKLLRVLQTGEFQRVGSSQSRTADVRLISATNLDLHQEVARRALPRRPAVSHQHGGDPRAAPARAARRRARARRAVSPRLCPALRQAAGGVRFRRHARPAGLRLARQRPRIVAHGGARRPSGGRRPGGARRT